MSAFSKDIPVLPGFCNSGDKLEASNIRDAIEQAPAFSNKDARLSYREHEVAQIVASGKTNKEAAEVLFVTEKTIKFHLTNIFKKLGYKGRSQLIIAEANRRAGRSMQVSL